MSDQITAGDRSLKSDPSLLSNNDQVPGYITSSHAMVLPSGSSEAIKAGSTEDSSAS